MPLNTKFFNPSTFDEEEIYTRKTDLGDPNFKSAASESAKGLRRGVANVRSGILSQRAAFNELTGDIEERDELERRAEEAAGSARGFEARIGDYRDIESVGDVLDYGVGGMFESLPFMAPAIAGGALGRGVVSKLGAGVRAKNVATAVGAGAGLTSPETGFTYEEIRQETGERDPYRAFGAGVTKAALDTFSLGKGIKGVFGKGGVRDIAGTTAREGITEAMQEGIDVLTVRNAKGEDMIAPLGGETTARLVNAGLLGAAAGAGFSTVGKATKGALERYRGKNPDKTLDEMLREQGVMDAEGAVDVPDLGGKISFSRPDADEAYEGAGTEEELHMEEFGELSGVVAFNDPDITFNSKGLPWVSNDMYKASGVQNPGDALTRQMQTLNRQAVADSALYQSELQKLDLAGASEEQRQALLDEHSPYTRRPYSDMVSRIAEVDDISFREARDQVVRSIVDSNPRFAKILSEAGPKYILDNLFYIEKKPQFKSEELSGFSDAQLYGAGDAKAKARSSIIRKPKATKKGVVYATHGEVMMEVTSQTGKRKNMMVSLPNLVKYSMYSVKRKEGQSLQDYVAEALYSGLAELSIGRTEADTSNIAGEAEKAKTKAEIKAETRALEEVGEKSDRLLPKGLTQEEKESVVVYSEFRSGKTPNHITLAEVERSGAGRTKARIEALNARRQRINQRAGFLKKQMQDMEMNIAIFGISPKAQELKAQWMKARDAYGTLTADLDRAFEEHATAVGEAERVTKQTQRAKDIDIAKDIEDFQTFAGESPVETGVVEAVKKVPVKRKVSKTGETEKEALDNFNLMEEQFEKNLGEGDYATAIESFKSMIQVLEETKQFLLTADATKEMDVRLVRQEFYKFFPEEMEAKKPLSMKDLIKKVNGKIWGLNQRLDAERARLSNVGEKPKKKKAVSLSDMPTQSDRVKALSGVREGDIFSPWGSHELYTLKRYSVGSEKYKRVLRDVYEQDTVYRYNKDYVWAVTSLDETVAYSAYASPSNALSLFEELNMLSLRENELLSEQGIKIATAKKVTKKDAENFDSTIKKMHRDLKDIYGPMESDLPKAFRTEMEKITYADVEEALDKYKQERADTVSEIKKELSRAGLEKEVYALDIIEMLDYGLSNYFEQAIEGTNEGFAGSIDAFRTNVRRNLSLTHPDKIAALAKLDEMEAKGYKQMMFAMPINVNKLNITDVIRHEVGHTILNHHREKITCRLGEEIIAEYEAWRDKFRAEEDPTLFHKNLMANREDELVRKLKEGLLFTANGTHRSSQQYIDYMEMFDEWFADKARNRLRSPARPVSVVDRFFEALVEAIRAFLGVSKGNYEGSAENFVDRLLSHSSNTAWEYARSATDVLVDVAGEVFVGGVLTSETDSVKDAQNKVSMFDQLDAYFKKTLGRGVGPAEIDQMLKMSGIGVTDAISAAFHNSMIEAVDTLYTTEERNVLLRAAKSPAIIRQLRTLLQPYPRAFEEAQADPKVAAAYMYQFWMTGHIKLGNKTKDNFYKAQGIMDDVLGIIHDQENAEHLLEEFVRGNVILAEQTGDKRYALKQVVKDTMIKKVVHDYMVPMTDKLLGKKEAGGAFGSLFSAAQTRMMDTKNPYIMQLANMVNPQVGQEGVGQAMIPARKRRIAEYSNVAHEIFRGKSRDHGIEVISLLNSGKEIRFPQTDVEKDAYRVRKEIMEPMHKYFKGAGLNVGKLKNYFPWVFDTEYLQENSYALENLLSAKEFKKPMRNIAVAMSVDEDVYWKDRPTKQEVKDGADRVMSNEVAASILVGQIRESGGYADVHHAVKGTGIGRSNPQMSAINKRTLQFVFDYGTDAQKQRFGEFMSQNLGLTLITYIEQGVKRAEYHRRFSKPALDAFGNEPHIVYDELIPKDASAKERDELMTRLVGAGYKQRVKDFEAALKIAEKDSGKPVPTEIEFGLATFTTSKIEELYFNAVKSGASVKELELMTKYMDAVMGTLGKDTNRVLSNALGLEAPPVGELVNPKLQRAMGIAMVYQNVRLLALSALTSLADPIGIAVRTGDIGMSFSSMGVGIREAFKAAKGDESTLVSMAEMLGVIDLEMTVDALNWEYGGVYMVGPEKRLNEAFFKYNLLQGLTRTTRIMAAEAATRFIKKHIQKPDRNSARYLSELNLDAQDVSFDKEGKVIVLDSDERTALYHRMQYGTMEQKMSARKEFVADERVRTAINSFVDTSILRPDATLRPIWASDPHFMLVFHLKSFMYAFSERILMRAYIEAKNSNTAPIFMLMLFIPAMLAADVLRDLIKFGVDGNPRKDSWGWSDHTMNAVQRAGLYGIGQLGEDVIRDVQYGGVGLAPLLGPTLEQAGDIFHATMSDTQDYDMIKALPAHSIYQHWGQ